MKPNQTTILSHINKMLPRLIETDDYNQCLENKGMHCRVVAKLFPQNETYGLWKELLNLETNHNLLDRTLLQRGLCIHHYEEPDEQCKSLINMEVKHYNFSAEILNVTCSNGEMPETMVDRILLLVMVFLCILIIMATIMDKNLTKMEENYAKALSKFSIFSSWKQIINVKGNEDFNKLKSIQGIRLYNTIFVLTLHAKIKFMWLYISNYEFMEEIYRIPAVQALAYLDIFLVSTYFMISSFLLTNQIYTLMDRNKKVELLDIFTVIVNRYFRFAATLFLVIMLFSSSYLRYFVGPHTMQLYLMSQKACRKNWLATVLFYNNYEYLENSCNLVTWYLAADFQMYVIIATALYIIFKFKLNEWKIMGLLTICSMIIYGASIYFLNLGVVFEPSLRNGEILNFMRNYMFWGNYTSTQSIWTSSFVGMILGAVYYKTKYVPVKNTPIITIVWFLCFAGLPTMAVLNATKTYEGILAALIGPLLKPIFALGIGLGILGMSHNIGGIVKKICEWKFAIILSNFTYCCYLCNFLVIICNHNLTSSPIELTNINFYGDITLDNFKCLFLGIIMAVAVEQPGLALQKLWLPQVRKCKLKDDK